MPAHAFDDVLDDGEPETRPRLLEGLCVFGPEELGEETRKRFPRDSDARVLDPNVVRGTKSTDRIPAATADEALRHYHTESPDLLLVDLMMEEVDAGTALVTKLEALGNKAPVYRLSSVGEELSANVDREKLGLAGVFPKPINAKVPLRTLDTRLRR